MSVADGFIFSLVAALFAGSGLLQLFVGLELRSVLLLIFFSTIGLNARVSVLASGGKAFFFLVIAYTICLIFQNFIGIFVVILLGK